ncbi:G-protein coupled receptor 157 [Lingula anatina]|uniref:G-protein coupled receptor 157 n=1 Tax=Lingula anatina TaxID=7574 RepID=A0A1S3H603_LINAN|nr:G-protein coupled receptor 157 [Lingula anatina]XP_013381413.1 G-protein coupled receptor 157 [Lingula anatina]XP_013381414.1 G-protein coupled receptor 157 [Lingula anatina]|eukprot:XP_013381412.1 G-protein coupled receptor 157 [Lingula anatina]
MNGISVAVSSLTLASSFLSWCGCILIFGTWLFFKDIRSSSRRLLLYLALADFLIALGNASGAIRSLGQSNDTNSSAESQCENPTAFCKAQSFIITFGSMSSFFWTMIIAWQVRETILHAERTGWTERHHWLLHVIAWGIPVIILTVTLSLDMLGYQELPTDNSSNSTISDKSVFGTTGGWCWIKVCQNKTVTPVGEVVTLTLLAGKGWELGAMVVLPLIYCSMKIKLRKTIKQTGSLFIDRETLSAVKKTDRVMTAVPVVFFLLRLAGTLRYLANTIVWIGDIDPPSSFNIFFNKALAIYQAVGDSGQGFGNFIIYCVLTDILRERICTKLGFCKKDMSTKRYHITAPYVDELDDGSDRPTTTENSSDSDSTDMYSSAAGETTPILRDKSSHTYTPTN